MFAKILPYFTSVHFLIFIAEIMLSNYQTLKEFTAVAAAEVQSLTMLYTEVVCHQLVV